MSSKKRIIAFTATRSDYDLLSKVYKLLDQNKDIDFGLIVSGTHLSHTYGYSFKEIEADGLQVHEKIECLLDSNSNAGRLKSSAIFLQEVIGSLGKLQPDLALICGDREDMLMAAIACGYLQIPTAHFFGGDHAMDGNIDNPVRHAISKLANLHCVCLPEHSERLLALGEKSSRIQIVGSPSLDKLVDEAVLTRSQVLEKLAAPKDLQKYAVLTYHPMLQEEDLAGIHVTEIIESLLSQGYFIFANSPNIDAGSKNILKVFDTYKAHPQIRFFKNLDRNTFINLLRHSDLMIGNSSGGILEGATLKVPVINVGLRQKGRTQAGNVVFCENSKASIDAALKKITEPAYKEFISKVQNPYGDGTSSKKIAKLLADSVGKIEIKKPEDPLHE